MPYIQNALGFLVEAVLGFYLIVCTLRCIFQMFRVAFRNPISQVVVVLTNYPLKILNRFIPDAFAQPFTRYLSADLAAIVLILIVAILKTISLLLLSGIPINLAGAVIFSIGEIINTVVWTLIIAILASSIISWIAPASPHPAIQIVSRISDSLLLPFRKFIPALQGIDISPIFALLTLNLIQKLVAHPLTDLGWKIIRGVV